MLSCNLRCRLIFLHGCSRTYRVASLLAGPVGRISYNLYLIVNMCGLSLGLPTIPYLIPGGDSLLIDGRKLAVGETFFGVLDARTRVLENLG